jgi:hypothetical protein
MIQTKDDIIRNLEIANSRLLKEREIARYDADSFRTAARFLWQTVKAAYDEYQERESLSEATMEQMLTSLERAEQEGETE